uniref:Uncharacterized protein n=1 Tax=Mustela putorius furo TaxID=9669 RepID=M3YTQ0_MUSPF
MQSSGGGGLGHQKATSIATSATNAEQAVNASNPCFGPSSKHPREGKRWVTP